MTKLSDLIGDYNNKYWKVKIVVVNVKIIKLEVVNLECSVIGAKVL